MKKIIQIFLFVLFAACVAGLMGFIYIEQGRQSIKQVIISINHEGEKGFISESMIKNLISNFDSLPFQKANQVHPATVESNIYKNLYVKSADVFVNIDKNLIINIKEKEAFLRIYNQNNNGFYIDPYGYIIPLSKEYTPRVLVANGYINIALSDQLTNVHDTLYRDTPLPDLFQLTKLINKNKFLKAQIGQIYVNSQGEYDLVPQLGNHLIRFGNMDDAKQKLENLELFYKEALIKEGWEKYEIINLKYKNQVVCKRK